MPGQKPSTLAEIFQRLDDFNLCDAISSAAEDHYGYEVLINWPQSVPIEHKLPHFVWSVTGFLECEGFARFFGLKCKHSVYPECFDVLGLPALATSVRKSLKFFPECDLGDSDLLVEHFGSWEQIRELVDAAESTFYSDSKTIETALGKYIRERQSKYRVLLPRIGETRSYREAFGDGCA